MQDPSFFPNAGVVREIFSHFGPVVCVTILSSTDLTVLVQFEYPVSATALVNSTGMSLGGRHIVTQHLNAKSSLQEDLRPQPVSSRGNQDRFDPFINDMWRPLMQLGRSSIRSDLSADSQPFVPTSITQADLNLGHGGQSFGDQHSRESTASSDKTKLSPQGGKMMQAENKGLDRWSVLPRWCE